MPKIIIKPRNPLPEPVELDNDDFDAEAEPEAHDNADIETQSVVENSIRVPAKRPRGRPPKGKGRVISSGPLPSEQPASGASTPRGRGRARGRPRGRGSALMIRLPKRADDDDEDEDAAAATETEDAEAVVDDGVEGVDQKDIEPAGGGKPFRRIHGEVYIIEGDEFVTENDPKGDEKIDQWGNLLGGRRYKANTFVLPNRHPNRLYMLAIDAARTSGFRDSLYYFRRNLLAFKLNATQLEKEHLISEGKLGSHLKTRSVTLITARSAYKLHGSKMVVDGRWVTDDYYEEKTLAEISERGLKAGDPVGDLVDPSAQSNANDQALNQLARNDRLNAGTVGLYRAGGPTTVFGGSGWGPFSDGPLNAVRKSLLSRDAMTEDNWMFKMASKVLESGEEWAQCRKAAMKPNGGHDAESIGTMGLPYSASHPAVLSMSGTLAAFDNEGPRKRPRVSDGQPPIGIYEAHTGNVYLPKNTQPMSARLERVSNSSQSILGGTKVGNGAWGIAWVETVMERNASCPESDQRDTILRQLALEEQRMDVDMT